MERDADCSGEGVGTLEDVVRTRDSIEVLDCLLERR